MSEAQATENPQHSPDLNKNTTPPPDATESELKLSRKREREVSVEPVTTPTASNDIEPLPRERKDSRVPLKKNRRRLDPTAEEEDNGCGSGGSGSPSPPILASPRQEMKIKVRQISQGVEDISWKNMQNATYDKDEDVEIDTETYEATLEPALELTTTTQKDKVNRHAVMDEDDTPPKTPDDSQLSQSIQSVQDDAIMTLGNLSPDTPNRLRAGSESGEKGLKRKFLERGTSQGPLENEEPLNHAPEPLKRLRDECDKDDNPRENKRPSPPPSPPKPSPPPKLHKSSGFIDYASSSSPFATIKGQNIFLSGKVTPSPPLFTGSPASVAAFTDFNSIPGQSSTTTPTVAKRPGFAFGSTTSPFAAVARTKSPVLGSPSKIGRAKSPVRRAKATNAFASYAGSVSFAVPASKRVRAGSPDGSSRSSLERNPMVGAFGGSADGSDSGLEDDGDNQTSSFGERLRAAKDSVMFDGEPKVQLSEQDVMTGEEDEDTIYSVRGKLFTLDDNSWKEKGTGLLKLNVKREDGTGARLVMRKDAVYTVILNVTLFGGMRCSLAQDPRYLRVSAIENGVATTYNIKFSNAGIARDLMEEINSNIPL